ncbi:MAG: hypothetical protein IPN87_19380 [Saprospiraceae bacterium]|nr:hypothetical protein [Candidatus Brachybacter algidus]
MALKKLIAALLTNAHLEDLGFDNANIPLRKLFTVLCLKNLAYMSKGMMYGNWLILLLKTNTGLPGFGRESMIS